MSLIAKGSSSLRKKDVMEQKGVALGFKKLRFAHKASVGETGINLTTLVQPTEMAAHGFVNPPVAQLSRAQMLVYRSNLKLVSSLRGVLVDQLSYTIGSNTQINFIDFTAEDGEIFMGWLDELPTTSLTVVDGQKIIASGTLLAGQTDFNIGVPITINKNPSSQHGEVMVFADRGLQYRKAGNQASGAGDYIEVEVPGGLGSLLRFTASGVDRFISVLSNGVVAERPDGSMMAAIERVQGQVDQMVPTLAEVAGVPETTFQTGPNSVDLKQFGDMVLGYENRITALENPEALLAQTGYQKLPSGMIMQWGLTGILPDDTETTITFPIAFPNACLNVNATCQYGAIVSGNHVLYIDTVSTTSFVLGTDDPSTTSNPNLRAYWFAIGY